MPPSAREQKRRCDADRGGEKLDHARRTVAARTNSIVSPSMTVDQRRRHADLPLHRLRARLEQPDEQRRRHDGERLHRAEQRHRHRLEAEAEREAFDQPVMDAEHLDAAREARRARPRSASRPR